MTRRRPALTALPRQLAATRPHPARSELVVVLDRGPRLLHISGDIGLDRLIELYTFTVSPELVALPEAPQLTRITAGVSLELGQLEDLALFRNVTRVGGLHLLSAPLASLQDLSRLEQIGPPDTSGTATATATGLALERTGVSDLSGLASLESVHGDISILENPALTTLDGLSLQTWESKWEGEDIQTSLTVGGNEALTDVSALSWLDTIELPRPCSILVEIEDPDFDEEQQRLETLCD